METTIKNKLISLDTKTFKSLSIMAVDRGTNLKSLIEEQLKTLAEDYEDAKLYAYLAKTRPDGKVIASDEETSEFRQFLNDTI